MYIKKKIKTKKLPNNVEIDRKLILSEPIYRAIVNCNQYGYSAYYAFPEQLIQCGILDYNLSYLSDYSNSTNFIIDSNTVNIILIFLLLFFL